MWVSDYNMNLLLFRLISFLLLKLVKITAPISVTYMLMIIIHVLKTGYTFYICTIFIALTVKVSWEQQKINNLINWPNYK